MSQELFYTSAPKGLQPGSRGFCTVAATRGMSAALVERLESLSGYRPLFPPHDARAGLNPVAYAHVRVGVGGRTYTVVSRIGPAGLDYTERPNKFAHHVVLDPAELPPGGPAWLLRQPGFLESRWDGRVQVLAAGRMAPRGDHGPEVCRNWQALTGDAGWGGVLAEAFQADPSRPVYLIYEPGTDLLPLLAESLALLPPAQRWDVTFSTYFTGLPQGTQCLWRCIPRGSPEAKAARQSPGALVLDLGQELGRARGGALVARARGQAASAFDENGEADPRGSFEKAGYTPPLQPAFGREKPDSSSSRPAVAPPPPLPPAFTIARAGMGWPMGAVLGMVVGLGMGVLLTLGFNNFGIRPGSPSQEGPKPAEGNVRSEVAAAIRAGPVNDRDKEKRDLPVLRASTVVLLGSAQGHGPFLTASALLAEKKTKGSMWLLAEAPQGARKAPDRLDELISTLKEIAAAVRKSSDKSAAQANKAQGAPKPGNNRGPAGKNSDEKKPAAERKPQNGRPPEKPIRLVQHHFRIPNEGKNRDKLELSTELKYKLKLKILDTSVDAKNDLLIEPGAELKIRLKGENKPLARFWLEGAHLHFEWINTEKKQELRQARRLLRNSVLEIAAEGGPDKEMFLVGLMQNSQAQAPIVCNFSNGPNPFKFNLDSLLAEKPLPGAKLFVRLADCEVKSARLNTTSADRRLNLKWQGGVELRVTRGKDDKINLEAKWNGTREEAPILTIKSFVICMPVDDVGVDILKVTEKVPQKK